MFYSAQSTGTMISPDYLCQKTNNPYTIFIIRSEVAKGVGTLLFTDEDKNFAQSVSLSRDNGLWFLTDTIQYSTLHNESDTIKKLTTQQQSELWSAIMGYPGQTKLDLLPKQTEGIPKLNFHPFRSLPWVEDANIRKATAGKEDRPATKFAQRFSMDFSFIRESSETYKQKKDAPRIVRSRKGYSAALTILDRKTRRLFGFPTDGKDLPLDIIKRFFERFDLKYGTRVVRVDIGGELARSDKFRQVIADEGYIL